MERIPRHRQFLVLLGLSCLGLICALLLRWTGDSVLPFLAAAFAGIWLFGFEGGLTVVLFSSVFALLMTVEQSARGWTQVAEMAALGLVMAWVLESSQRGTHRYRSMAASMADALIVADRAGCVTYMNPAAEALTGVPFAKARKKHVRELVQFRDRRTGDPVELPVDEALAGGLPATAPPRRLTLLREGPESEVEETIAPLRSRAGKIEGVILTIRDTTRRREAQDQLSRSQKMDALARMAGGVAGDFNNLLTVITGYGEMLRNELGPATPLRRFAEEIGGAADRAAALTQQLMAFSRHESPLTRVIDLNASIANMETTLSRLLGEGIDLVLIPGPGILRVKADSGQIDQLVANLAMNSRDAMPQGGKFLIETSSMDLTADSPGKPDSLAAGPYVALTVSDTGVGMDSDTLSRLFEPFFTTKTHGRSTGLGLSIVYGIVTQAGGDISVYSQPGGGTIFEIYLPKAKEDLVVRRPSRGPRGTETILVADDESGVRKLVHAVLATSGYTVVEAQDGAEALDLFQAGPDKYDLILTDVVMPHLNGFELGDRVAAADPSKKILYMTGFRDTPITGQGLQDRARIFLPKPFTPDALLARVRDVLDGKLEARA
jgi:PAS domain S-box-containing protein